MLGMLHDLQAPIEHEEETAEEEVRRFDTCPTCGESWYKASPIRGKKNPAQEGWKHFDSEFPEFASGPRNVRFGLTSDEFNPFGHMSTAYSTMSNFPTGFYESDDLFDFNVEEFNTIPDTPLVGNTSSVSQLAAPTPRRRQHSRNLKLDRYVAENGKIPHIYRSRPGQAYLATRRSL
ncbi:Transposon, En/Spm-like protein [Cucumis melo var. makuwa]|uniref:Transposon, En/Spm-like protein n=1 Tax=Cucumis melo var. makuwa TaxID=1194695 RepID=A0A5D3CSU8_CUCMM|nr:Transposon, En/Spm-like protein [Cucumis melo var. makuwa]TYK14585.1 Transposon, En/Spm-like protein [Cucumis melo var. makuwa]